MVTPDTSRPAGNDPRLCGGRVTVDVAALAANYRLLAGRVAPARVAGVLKANAYGLGIDIVAPVLWAQGCRTFFVALPQEGLDLRAILPEAEIFVLAGLFSAESAAAYRDGRLLPVLNDPADVSLWEAFGWDDERGRRPCAIHADTGMSRLGLSSEELRALAAENALTGALTPVLLMSHLACADDPVSDMNPRQLESFQRARSAFSGVSSSLANSAGIFLADAYHGDLVRPGIALYGGAPRGTAPSPMQPVVTLETRVVQVRKALAGARVSYGGTQVLTRDTLIAVAASGYADGLHRAASGAGVPLRQAVAQGGHGFAHGQRVPILGRVTMDLTMFDITDLPAGAIGHGDHIELFGANIAIDDAAAAAGTIAYELLTSLGSRYYRRIAHG